MATGQLFLRTTQALFTTTSSSQSSPCSILTSFAGGRHDQLLDSLTPVLRDFRSYFSVKRKSPYRCTQTLKHHAPLILLLMSLSTLLHTEVLPLLPWLLWNNQPLGLWQSLLKVYLSQTLNNRSHMHGQPTRLSLAHLPLEEFKLVQQRDPTPLHCAAKLIINSQMENGDFPQQASADRE